MLAQVRLKNVHHQVLAHFMKMHFVFYILLNKYVYFNKTSVDTFMHAITRVMPTQVTIK